MNEFEQLVHDSYRRLLEIGPYVRDRRLVYIQDGQRFFDWMFENLPGTIADKETLTQIQIGDLFQAMNHTRTATGAATLYRSLIQPLTSLDLILAKQEALREMEGNSSLRDALKNYLEEIRNQRLIDPYTNQELIGDEILYKFLVGDILLLYPYWDFRAAMKIVTRLSEAAQSIPKPNSRYLDTLVTALQKFSSAESYRLARGPIYRTLSGLKSRERAGFFTPSWKFLPRLSTVPTVASLMTFAYLFVESASGIRYLQPLMTDNPLWFMLPTIGAFYFLLGKSVVDVDTVMKPLLRILISDPEFQVAIDSLGKLDELVSFYDYAKAMPVKMKLPKIDDESPHYFRATSLANPILAKDNPQYVTRDVELDGCKLTFVTGPNSGGKTTLVKTIAQIQLMAQTGSYVPADSAEMSVVDKLSYQYHLPDKLQTGEGDFGVNLARTRDLFYATTPRSLVIFNTLASGTTPHEGDEQSIGILTDFAIMGNNTIYVTHNYKVVEEFERRGIGQFLQTYFVDGKPTYKFVPGISRESHAAKIAEKIGFSPEDRRRHLIEKGYLNR